MAEGSERVNLTNVREPLSTPCVRCSEALDPELLIRAAARCS
jgi:hypothetical protein